MLTFKGFLKHEKFSLFVLMLISSIARFPFVLKGFGETDSANLAVSIIDFINHGIKGFLTNLYFIDTVPLYVIYLKFIMKLLNYNYTYLTVVMNYTNAIVGTLMVIPVYLLVKKLFDNSYVAFNTGLTFIFVPSIYQASIYGFPALLALFFFVSSLYLFYIWLDNASYVWLILSFIASTAAILFKFDFILGSGAYLGLLYIRKVRDKKLIILSSLSIILSLVFFLLIRQLVTGINKGYTTSPTNFLEFFKYFFNLLFLNKGLIQVIKDQVRPIVYGMGFLNFFMASIAVTYYLVKRKSGILIFVLLWVALPTLLWLFIHGNSARHNMLSVLPFLMIIFLFLNEKAPKLMAIFPIILILGNYLLTSPSESTRSPSGDLFKSQAILDNRVKSLHRVAGEIAGMKDRKIILTTESFRPYLYYEIFTLIPEYELIELGNSCYEMKNEGCIICTKLYDTSYLAETINKHGLFDYNIVAPQSIDLNFTNFKTRDVKIYRYEG